MKKQIEQRRVEEEYLYAVTICLEESLIGQENKNELTEQFCELVLKLNIDQLITSNTLAAAMAASEK